MLQSSEKAEKVNDDVVLDVERKATFKEKICRRRKNDFEHSCCGT
jgi:hypothetical protein